MILLIQDDRQVEECFKQIKLIQVPYEVKYQMEQKVKSLSFNNLLQKYNLVKCF
jgi:hypothetical protein